MRLIKTLLIICLLPTAVWSQTKAVLVFPPCDSVFLDSMVVRQSTLKLSNPTYSWRISRHSGWLIFNETLRDTVEVRFETFGLPHAFSLANKDSTIIRAAGTSTLRPYIFESDLFPTTRGEDGDLVKAGSISRGVTFGNNQDLAVNSNLNLQISGKISERFQVLASVTDDNIPIQPNGNTQQLQDFDQVYIRIFDPSNAITAGDFFIRESDQHFLKYQKRARGATFESTFGDSLQRFKAAGSAAISKGKFARNVIQGVEGNQGPYRLIGADNERFIIVLAGTERVFINGRLLQRGQENDYVIDYNTAEIVFTPRNLITKDRRIVVEFQYSDRNFARALLHGEVSGKQDQFSWFVHGIREQDSKNQPLQQNLSPEERLLLTTIGDQLDDALVSSIDTTSFSDSQVLYALRDSLGYDSVLVYSTSAAEALYSAVFTFVGAGNGDYVEDAFQANGRVYKWVAPQVIDGNVVRLGDYAPVRLLVTPKRRQMFIAGGEVKLGKHTIRTEGALTKRDENTFSKEDSFDDTGSGLYTEWKVESQGSALKLQSSAYHEYISQYFSEIERFRGVEFDRDWNIRGLTLRSDQQRLGGSLGVEGKTLKTEVRGAHYRVGSAFIATQGGGSLNYRKNARNISWEGSAIQSSGQRNSIFIRQLTNAAWPIGKKFRIGYIDDFEWNRFLISDSLTSASYRFHEWQSWLGSAEEAIFTWKLFYGQRNDRLPTAGMLELATMAEEYGLEGMYRKSANSMLKWNVRRRVLTISDTLLTNLKPEETLLGRLEGSSQLGRGWLSGQFFYETGSGLEQQRKFIYIEVPAGQGTYIWNDYNADGVKDLNEFEVANFAYEANYIRSFVPSDEYVRTYTNVFSINGQLQPMRVWSNQKGLKGFLSRWSDVYAMRLDRKTTRDKGLDRLNPLESQLADTSLLSLGESYRNTLSFNRSNPNFGVEHTLQRVKSKTLLSSGFESRSDAFNEVLIRKKVINGVTALLTGRLGVKTADSDFLTGRNYDIDYYLMEPQLQWQPDNRFRITAKGKYTDKRNSIEGADETAQLTDLSAEARFSDPGKGLFSFEFHWVNIDFNGESNNTIGFEMLEGLSPGENFTWGGTMQRSISRNLQLSILYNGRTAGDRPVVHAGSVQVRATF